jgi:hypothetical protein
VSSLVCGDLFESVSNKGFESRRLESTSVEFGESTRVEAGESVNQRNIFGLRNTDLFSRRRQE